jgi:phosphoglycerate dehydrogenase-like enzyme
MKVLIADFLDETSVEAPILGDRTTIEIARAANEDELGDRPVDADVIILYHDISRLSARTLERAPRCRGVVRAGVGYNNVDIETAGKLGIVVCNVPDYGTEEVADHAIMLLLAMARKLAPCDRAIRSGEWDYRFALGAPRLRGKTIGIVGCGRIGAATALRAKALGLNVLIYDPKIPHGVEKALGVERVQSLAELAERSLFVSVHCYLDQSTLHLIDANFFAKLAPGSYLINTARGPIVDENALLAALDSGKLAGAGLDVVEIEPLANDRLRKHPNIILTPHSAFYSVEGFIELRSKTAAESMRLIRGEDPLNPVNREFLVDPRYRRRR